MIRIIKPLENSGLLIDSITETVKYEIKKQESGVLPSPMNASLIAPTAFSLVGGIFGK